MYSIVYHLIFGSDITIMLSQIPNTETKLNNVLNNIDSILYMAETEASNLLTQLHNAENNNRKDIKGFLKNNLTSGSHLVYNNHTLSNTTETLNEFDRNNSIHKKYLSINTLRYYVEGVVLVPVSIIGLFGR